MKKILSIGIAVFLLILLLLVTISSTSAWVINGSKVEYDDENVYLSAEPHHIYSSSWAYFNLTTKNYTGLVNVMWGFNSTVAIPSRPQVPDGWVNKTHSTTFINVSSFENTEDTCEFGHSYNTYKRKVFYRVNHSAVVCFDSYSPTPFVQGENYTCTWHTAIYQNWNDVSASRFSHFEYSFQGMTNWYMIKNVSVVAGVPKRVRAWIEVPVSLEEVSGKYWWALKPTNETISQAIVNGHFYYLDPWYSASWSHRKQWTVTNVNTTTLTNYPAYINISDEAEMQADWDDVVFTDSSSNKIAYELENYTASYGDYWVNISSLPGSGTYTGWIYYGNDGAASQENPEGVYDANTAMVQHLQEAPANGSAGHLDSTSNNNDGTPQNFNGTATSTTDASGKIDGADVFDSTDDYVDCGNDVTLNITDAITIEAWIYPLSLGGGAYGRIVSKYFTTYEALLIAPNRVQWTIVDSSSNTHHQLSNSNSIIMNAWNYVVVGYTGSQQNTYINSILQSDVQTWTDTINTSNEILYIGNRKDFIRTFNGTIDNVVISSTARSADWINQSYQLVTNQSNFVTFGGAEESWVNTPINLAETHNNFWVNWTWQANNTGDALHTDSFNISYWINLNHYWDNSTNTSRNETVGTHGWLNISVQAYNSTTGKLSSAVSGHQQIPNNPITITDCSDWSGEATDTVYIDFNFTDSDSDSGTFATNATEGSLDTATGIYTWTTGVPDIGTYYWLFNVTDGYSTDDCIVTITVEGPNQPILTDWFNNHTNDNDTSFTISSADNRTVFFNVTANQSITYWVWHVDGTEYQNSSSDNITKTWDDGGDKTVSVYGTNAKGQTSTLTWNIEIEYTELEYAKLIYNQNLLLIEENEMIAQTWIFLIFMVVMFVLITYSFIDRRNPYYANIFASFFAMFIAFLLATWCLGELVDRPELSYFFVAVGIVMLFATIIFVVDAIQEYMPLTSRAKKEAENKRREEMESYEW